MYRYLYFLTLFLSTFFIQGQCLEPTSFGVISISETSAELVWVETGTSTTWEIETVLSGVPPSGIGNIATTNPFTISNLVSGETYDFYLRSICDNSNTSSWIGPLATTTLSCEFTIDAVETPESCLEYCFYANGTQFGTFFDFNSGTLPVGWNSSPFTVGSPCFTDMIDDSPYFWAGVTDANNERQVTTNPLDVTLGGIVQFYMRYGSDDPDPGCETADLPEEGVNLQYSINGGTSWVTMNYWMPTNILTDDLYNWTQYTETIPLEAQTNNTMFRWYQSDNSGPEFDNWGLDNVLVSANTNANFLWDFGDGNTSTLSSPCHAYSNEGPYTVTLSVNSPNCNNTATTDILVEDDIFPTTSCQNISITLDSTGNATISASDIDNGSTDNCGIQSLSISQTNFNCNDVGLNNVTLTAVDIYGNFSSCDATVTINPTLAEPTGIVITPTSTTTAEIFWVPSGSETSWEIEIVPFGTFPTGAGIITSTIPYIATSLAENTEYSVYIKGVIETSCSGWAGPVNFQTPCNVFSVPYVETVETQILGGPNSIGNCWSADITSFSWRSNSGNTASTNTGPNSAANGNNYFYTEATGANFGDEAILLSPIFDLTTSSNTYLHFFYHMYGSDMGELHVDVFDGNLWIEDIFVVVGQQQSSGNDQWIQEFINISAYENVSNFQVRFRGIRGIGFRSDIAIDDITIESLMCPEPINFTANNPTATTVDLSWVEVGSAIQWEIEAVESGTTPTGIGVTTNSNPFTFSGLLPNVSYDFYIRSICDGIGGSNWVGPITVSTVCDDISFDNCPTNITISTESEQCFGIPNYTIPNLIDNCDTNNTMATLTQGLPPNAEFPIGITTVTYEASNSLGTTISCSFTVTVIDPFEGINLEASEIITDNTITLCNEETVDLTLTGGNFDGTETYEWQINGTTLTNETSNILAAVNLSGIYTVIVSLGTCSLSFDVIINQFSTNAGFIYNPVGCYGATASVTGSQGGTFQFETVPQDTATLDSITGAITNGTPGETYSVIYTTAEGPCQTSSTQTVTLLELDDASFYIDSETLTCFSANIIVTGTSIGTFSFNPMPSDSASINPDTGEISNTTPDTSYTIVYTTNDVCSNTEMVTYITPNNCVLPQGFSPNDDGFNDFFDVHWLEAKHIYIYNRYGNEVYNKSNYRNEWDGRSNTNDELPTGTYFYVILVKDSKVIKGWVYLTR